MTTLAADPCSDPLAALPDDPLAGGLAAFGRRLRTGEISARAATEAYLKRIDLLESKLGAFEHVAHEQARATADAVDAMLGGGIDLGPLMGVPFAVKDLVCVDGMPTSAGSNVPFEDILGAEGEFIGRLRRLGCVFLGKTRTVEFGLGSFRTWRGTPWNPCDPHAHRTPGGSSSGSGVAVAAGLCAVAIGTDTGGSVRIPSAFCGTFGLKTSIGLWPTDGVFPLSFTFDTIGLLTKSAEDAAIAFAAIEGLADAEPLPRPEGLVVGVPRNHFFEEISDPVRRCFEAAAARLAEAGVTLVDFDFPEAPRVLELFQSFSPIELFATIGRERFERIRDRLDPAIAWRLDAAREVKSDHYIGLVRQRRVLEAEAFRRLSGFDCVISPTAVMVAPVIAETPPEIERKYRAQLGWNTRPANVLNLCATSLPIHHLGSDYPVGLQIMCIAAREPRLLALSRAFQAILGAD